MPTWEVPTTSTGGRHNALTDYHASGRTTSKSRVHHDSSLFGPWSWSECISCRNRCWSVARPYSDYIRLVSIEAIAKEKKAVISELLAGVLISVIAVCVTKVLSFGTSIRDWILAISKFVYHSGHPLWDDEQRYSQVSHDYRAVAAAFFLFLAKLFTFLVAVFTCLACLTLIGTIGSGGSIADVALSELVAPPYLLHWPFLIGTLLPICSIPLIARKGSSRPESTYSVLDQFLHYLFLGNQPIAKFLFRLECYFRRNQLRDSKPIANVYVSGLARSGSTSLMQYLAQVEGYVSLTYRNMPFVFMPQTGLRIQKGASGEETERAHRDGMKHGLDTQEALEEPFWLHHCGVDFIETDRLICHSIDSQTHRNYQRFRTLVAKNETYLAKNNNHLLRAETLHELDAEQGLCTKTVIPFRDPESQSRSLLNQHLSLSAMQRSNRFVLDYMDFLGHYEFGLDHRVTSFEKGSKRSELPHADPATLDYWLDAWHLFFARALEIYRDKPDFCFFCYEAYAASPRQSLQQLGNFLDIDEEEFRTMDVREWTPKTNERCESVAPNHLELYAEMVEVSINGQDTC